LEVSVTRWSGVSSAAANNSAIESDGASLRESRAANGGATGASADRIIPRSASRTIPSPDAADTSAAKTTSGSETNNAAATLDYELLAEPTAEAAVLFGESAYADYLTNPAPESEITYGLGGEGCCCCECGGIDPCDEEPIPTFTLVHNTEVDPDWDPLGWGKAGPFAIVDAGLHACKEGDEWRFVVTGIVGEYEYHARLLPGVTEVTGPPPGNTAADNWGKQVEDLELLGYGTPAEPYEWFMLSAVEAHEDHHMEHARPSFLDVTDPELGTASEFLQSLIEDERLADQGWTEEEAIAAFRATDEYDNALIAGFVLWKGIYNDETLTQHQDHLYEPPHLGPAHQAAENITYGMVTGIEIYATQQNWPWPPATPIPIPVP
jgi:hypothetical protein